MGGSDDFERKYAKNVKDQQSGVVHSNSVGTHLPNQYSQMNESENKIKKYVQNKLAEMAGKKKPSINESKSTKLKALDKMIEEQYDLYNKKVKK
jgi:DNA anti-recombination protein RmuC